MLLNLTLKHTRLVNSASTITKALSISHRINCALSNQVSDFVQPKRQYSSLKITNSSHQNFFINLTGSRNMSTSQVNLKLIKSYENIVKSEKDKRLYRGLLLDNDLKCLLISDPSTDRSAASVDVHIGYMLDPKEFPGLAHFCEHMVIIIIIIILI